MHLSPEICNTADWLQKQVNNSNLRYADLHVVVRIHDGKISLIERSATEKIKPAEIIGGENFEQQRKFN